MGIGDLHEDLTRDLFSPDNVFHEFEAQEFLPSSASFREDNEHYAFRPHLLVSNSLDSLSNFCDSDQDILRKPNDSHKNDCDPSDDLFGESFENSVEGQLQTGAKKELHFETSNILDREVKSLEMVAPSLTNSENSISAPTLSGISTIPSNSYNTSLGLRDAFGDISAETSAPGGIIFRPTQSLLGPYYVPRRAAANPPPQPTEIIDLTKDDDSDVEAARDTSHMVKSPTEEAKSDTFLNAILDGVDNIGEDRLEALFHGAATKGEDGLPMVSVLVPSLDKVNAVLGLEPLSAGPNYTTQDDVPCGKTKEELGLIDSPCSDDYNPETPEPKKQTLDTNNTRPVYDAASLDIPQFQANQALQMSSIDAGSVSHDLLDKCVTSLAPRSKPKKKSSPSRKKKVSKREAARAASAAEQARQREIALLAKSKQISDDELLRLKPKKQRRAAKFDKPIPSRFCHVCSRTPKNVRLAVCSKIKEGICRKVICEKCFDEFGYGDFEAALETGTSSWCCPHCSDKCPDRAQCRTYQRINDRLRVNRLKQEKPKGRKRGRKVLEEVESSSGGGEARKKAKFLLPSPGGMGSVALGEDMMVELGIEKTGVVIVDDDDDGMGTKIEDGRDQSGEGRKVRFGVCEQEKEAGEGWNGANMEESEGMWGIVKDEENEGVGSEEVSTDTTVMMGGEEVRDGNDDTGEFGDWVMGEMGMVMDCKEKGNVEMKGFGGASEGERCWELEGMMGEIEGEGKLLGYF